MMGCPPREQRHICDYVRGAHITLEDATVRAQQLAAGVEQDFIGRKEVVRMMHEQPQVFFLGFSKVYEDDNILCVEKPNGIQLRLSEKQGRRDAHEPSLHDWLCTLCPSVLTETGTTRVCHNLDFATSGVLACAKSTEAAREVGRLFEDRRARKLYAALVFGHPDWDSREIK